LGVEASLVVVGQDRVGALELLGTE
jgi:hypothetical protein